MQLRIKPLSKAVFIDPIPDPPAERAGIERGESLHGHSVAGLPFAEVTTLLRGAVASPAALTVARPGRRPSGATVTRQVVQHPDAVRWSLLGRVVHLLASGQITMRKVESWHTIDQPLIITGPLDLAA